jgi:alkylation response protein AidB-like acyl-CoA dehydrogenase
VAWDETGKEKLMILRELSEEDRAFQKKTRNWLEANLPKHKARTYFGLHLDHDWQRIVAKGGYLGPHWRRDDGGMSLTPLQEVIMIEEWARAGAPMIASQEMNHIGPILLQLGTEEQKREHIPKMFRAECFWAQGYSEPGSGSDLSSLRTTGAIDGDTMVINGQKIWNTMAHRADWMFALIRTAEGRRGLTLILLDLTTPGVTRKSIKDLSGDHELAEVFFDNVRVPLANVVGDINDGWRVATAVLRAERLRAGCPERALNALYRLRKAAAETGADSDPWMAEAIARAELAVLTLEAAYLEALESERDDPDNNDQDGSCLKVLEAETTQSVLKTLQDVVGPSKAILTPPDIASDFTDFSKAFMAALANSIMGGTDEIQRTLIAQQALGLPRAAK